MSKTLVIVESNAKAQSIQKYLGDGYSVVPCYGHIADLPTNKMGVDTDNFEATYMLMKDKVSVLQTIMDAAKDCDNILLGSDPDREGSRISYDLSRYLESFGKPMNRVLFNEITKKGVADGIKNKGKIDQNQVDSQGGRRIIDRLVGFSCSPFISSHYKTSLSAGRVQSAVVKLIVDLEKTIENFKPQEYWNIYAQFGTKDKKVFQAKLDAKIQSQKTADDFVSQISNETGFIVSTVKAQDKPKYANPPLITVKLQQVMAKEYEFDAERTMKAAQSLYEFGHITYLRTDSVRISEDALTHAREHLKNLGFKLPKSSNTFEDKGSAQAGHECLRPTNLEATPDSRSFSSDERLVYKTIFEHFLASQMLPAIYSTINIKLNGIKNKDLIFKVSGKALKEPGYLSIFGDNKTETIDLPFLEKDEPVRLDQKSIKQEKKSTQPPSRYNDATILEDLEAKGIGRPATYASIIKTITARNYVEKVGVTFRPTAMGREVTELLEKSFSFVNSNYTSKMEVKLDQIAEGKLNSIDMLKEFYGEFKKQLDSAYINDGHDICSCGGVMVRRKSKNGDEFIGCTEFPSCKVTKSIEGSK